MEKFWARINNDGKAARVDSGGPLTMLRHGAHYVYGVLSTKVCEDNQVVRLFTDVLFVYHVDWRRQLSNTG